MAGVICDVPAAHDPAAGRYSKVPATGSQVFLKYPNFGVTVRLCWATHLQWLQQDFANLHEEKTKLLFIQESLECRIRSPKLMSLTIEQVEEVKLQ